MISCAKIRVLIAASLLVSLSGCSLGRADDGDVAFCTYISEISSADFNRNIGWGFPFQDEISDGRLRGLAMALYSRVSAQQITAEEGRTQLIDRCRAIRAL